LPGLLFFIFFPISMILPFILSPQNRKRQISCTLGDLGYLGKLG